MPHTFTIAAAQVIFIHLSTSPSPAFGIDWGSWTVEADGRAVAEAKTRQDEVVVAGIDLGGGCRRGKDGVSI